MKILALIAAVGVVAGCAGSRSDPHRDAVRAYIRETTGDDLRRSGLHVTVGGVTTDGRHAKIRGRVENGYDQPVDGMRLVVSFYDREQSRVLDTYQREVDTTLDPGESKMIAIDAESMYLGASGGGYFVVTATPVKLGDEAVAPPSNWE